MNGFKPRKLTPDQAREICARAWLGESQTQIARDFNIRAGMVSQIKLGYNYPGYTIDVRKVYQNDDELSERETEITFKSLENLISY